MAEAPRRNLTRRRDCIIIVKKRRNSRANFIYYRGAKLMKKIAMLISTSLIYVIFVILGSFFFDNFSEHVFIVSAIFFFILVLNFYCLSWKDNFISEFIVERKLYFLFIILALIYIAVFCIYFFRADGLNRIMYCTIWSSIVNVCICNFIYLR